MFTIAKLYENSQKKKKSSFTFSFITFPQHIDKAIMDSRYRGSKNKKKKKNKKKINRAN